MDILKEIYGKIIELWNSNLELLQQIKDWKQKIYHFIELGEKFFSIVPPEVILLFFSVALVMILLNNISPTTPRINLTIGVILFGITYIYLVYIFTNEWKIFRILYISSFILVPAYLLEIIYFSKKIYFRITFKKENLNSPVVKLALRNIHFDYAELVNYQNFLEEQPEKFIESLKKLESSVSKLRSMIEQTN